MPGYLYKSATAPVAVTFDWADGTLDTGELIEADLGWVLTPAGASSSLSVVGATSGVTMTAATLAGGRPGDAYRIANQIRTSAGRELERSVTLRVGDN